MVVEMGKHEDHVEVDGGNGRVFRAIGEMHIVGKLLFRHFLEEALQPSVVPRIVQPLRAVVYFYRHAFWGNEVYVMIARLGFGHYLVYVLDDVVYL